MALDYYSFQNAADITQIFNAVAALTTSDDYKGLIKVVFLAGGISAVLGTLVNNRFTAVNWFFVATLLYLGALVPKIDVVVVDRTGIQAPTTVSNVPIGFAFFGHFTSKLGDYFTTASETIFSLPNDMNYSENGMLFGHKALRKTMEQSFNDPTLRNDIYKFMANCAWYDMNLYGLYTLNDLRTSTDPLSVIQQSNMLLFTTVGAGNTQTLCQDAIGTSSTPGIIDTAINADVVSKRSYLGGIFWPDETPANALIKLDAALPTVYSQIIQSSETSAEIIQRNMLINALEQNDAESARLSGDASAVAIALASAQAEQAQLNTYRTMGNIAEGTLPKIRTVIEAVMLASVIFIIPIFIAAGHMAGKMIRGYIMTLLWLQMWPPMYAVLNFMQTSDTADNVYAMSLSMSGVAYANQGEILHQVMSDADIAGYMVLMIPMLSYAAIKGGEMIMSSMASQIMAPATQAASRAGQQAADGNWSYANTNFETHGGFKTDLSQYQSSMATSSRVDNLGNVQHDYLGSGKSTVDLAANSAGGWGANMQSTASHEATRQSEESATMAASSRTSYESSVASAIGETVSRGTDRVSQQALSHSSGDSTEAQLTDGYQSSKSMAQELASKHGISESSAATLIAQVTGGLGGNINGAIDAKLKGSGIGAGGQLSAEMRGQLQQQYGASLVSDATDAIKNSSSEQVQNMQRFTHEVQTNENFRNDLTSSQRDQDVVQSRMDEADRYSHAADFQEQRSQRLAQISRELDSESSSTSIDILKLAGASQMLNTISMMEHKGDIEGANALLRQKAADFVSEMADEPAKYGQFTNQDMNTFRSENQAPSRDEVYVAAEGNTDIVKTSGGGGFDTSTVQDTGIGDRASAGIDKMQTTISDKSAEIDGGREQHGDTVRDKSGMDPVNTDEFQRPIAEPTLGGQTVELAAQDVVQGAKNTANAVGGVAEAAYDTARETASGMYESVNNWVTEGTKY